MRASGTQLLPEIWCIIPHYGNNSLLDCCLESLRQTNYPKELFGDDRIVVVDHNPPNLNNLFTAGINTGIEIARNKYERNPQSPFCVVWLLNNDTTVESESVTEAVRCFQEEGWDGTGVVGCRVVLSDNPDFIYWGGSQQCFPNGLHKTGRVSAGDLAERTEEEWVTFSSAFINYQLIQEIGVLDKNFRHLSSDTDFCFRAREHGWKCFYEPMSVVSHKVGTSQFQQNAAEELQKIMRDDVNYFCKKWIQPLELFNSLTRYKLEVKQPEV